jgi:ribosome modulation factor
VARYVTEAYKVGFAANREGKSYTECPFSRDTMEYTDWHQGWNDCNAWQFANPKRFSL